jgi:hypothetical protein
MIQTYGKSGRPVEADGEVAEGGKVGEADAGVAGGALGDTDALGADAGDDGEGEP